MTDDFRYAYIALATKSAFLVIFPPSGHCPTIRSEGHQDRSLATWRCSYRVGSANFSRRKIGHAHDNSADSENAAGAREPSVHAHFIFRFENGQGNQTFFLSITKIQLKRVNRKLSRRTVDAPSTGRVREASSGPEKSLVPHDLVEKKMANFVDSRKLLLRGYKFKDIKHDRFGKRSAVTEAEEIGDRSTEADMNTLRRSIEFFFSFSTSSSNNFRFAFLALKVAGQAFT